MRGRWFEGGLGADVAGEDPVASDGELAVAHGAFRGFWFHDY